MCLWWGGTVAQRQLELEGLDDGSVAANVFEKCNVLPGPLGSAGVLLPDIGDFHWASGPRTRLDGAVSLAFSS